jgi:hypothetical protein
MTGGTPTLPWLGRAHSPMMMDDDDDEQDGAVYQLKLLDKGFTHNRTHVSRCLNDSKVL